MALGIIAAVGLAAYGAYQSRKQRKAADRAAGDARSEAERRQQAVEGRIGEVRSQFGIEDEAIQRQITDLEQQLAQLDAGPTARQRLGIQMSSQGDERAAGLRLDQLSSGMASERQRVAGELERLRGVLTAAGENRQRLGGLLDSQESLVADSADRAVLGGFQAGTTQSRQRLASRGLLGGSAAGQVRENLLTDMIAGREFAGEQGRAARSEAENALTSLRLRLEDQSRGSGEAIPGAAESLRQQGSAISQASANIGANTLGNLFKVGGSVYELDQTARGQGFSGLPSFNSLPANTRKRDRLSLTEVGR